MDRFDMYGGVHKGLRAGLFTVAQEIGRTDFRAHNDVVLLVASVRRLFGFLEEHAHTEDTLLMPELANSAPWAHAELAGNHVQLDGLQGEIEKILERLLQAERSERVALGDRLLHRFHHFVAQQLEHMEREETTGNRALWAHRSDEQLLALHGRILESIPAPRLLEWAELMAPALSEAEREKLRAGLTGFLPADALATVEALGFPGAVR